MTASYVLSQEADNDIEGIFEYGELKFGTSQAIEYLIGMNSHFEVIADMYVSSESYTEEGI